MMFRNDPHRAVILAAGLGSRLRPFTDDRPKPLVQVHGVPILHNALRNLASVGVREVTLVVGYRRESIMRQCGDVFAGVRISYVTSDVYDSTGSAYSLWLARETLAKGDCWLLEGDVFFDIALLDRVLHPGGDVAAVDDFDEVMQGSAAYVKFDGSITEFRTGQTAASVAGQPLYKTVNIYRFTASTLRNVIVPAFDSLMAVGRHKSYVEQVLADLIAAKALSLKGAMCSGTRWYEIDNEADLRRAERIFQPTTEVERFEPVLQSV